jgi:hypothetical protein
MTNIPETRLPIHALTASQYSQISATYERAAGDLTLPPQPRAAFAQMAKRFGMLARMTAVKQAMAVSQNSTPLSSPLMEPQRYRPLVGTDAHSSLPELELAKYDTCVAMKPQRYQPLVA